MLSKQHNGFDIRWKYSIFLYALVVIPNIILSFKFEGMIHDETFNILGYTHDAAHSKYYTIWYPYYGLTQDFFYNVVVGTSIYVARALIALIYIGGASVLLFNLLKKYFNVTTGVAFFASAAPFLTYQIFHIPLGINVSYVAGDLFFALLAMHLLLSFLTANTMNALEIIKLVFVFAIGSMLMPSSIVLTPLIFLCALTWGREKSSVCKRVVAIVVTSSALISVLMTELGKTRLPKAESDTYFPTLVRFLKLAPERVAPALEIPGFAILSYLIIILVLGTLFWKSITHLMRKGALTKFAKYGSESLSGNILLAAGLIYTYIPYGLISHGTNIQPRYVYIWGVFFWIALSIGIAFFIRKSILVLFSRLKSEDKKIPIVNSVTASCMIIFAVAFSYQKSNNIPSYIEQSNSYTHNHRKAFKKIKSANPFSKDQLLILNSGGSLFIPHYGNYLADTGYMHFIIKDHEFSLVNFAADNEFLSLFEALPGNVWSWGNKRLTVKNFEKERPFQAFHYDYKTKTIHQLNYIIDRPVSLNTNDENQFRLYDLRSGEAILLQEGSASDIANFIKENNISLKETGFGGKLNSILENPSL